MITNFNNPYITDPIAMAKISTAGTKLISRVITSHLASPQTSFLPKGTQRRNNYLKCKKKRFIEGLQPLTKFGTKIENL